VMGVDKPLAVHAMRGKRLPYFSTHHLTATRTSFSAASMDV